MSTGVDNWKAEAFSLACRQAETELSLFESVSTRLREMVPFHGSAWFATDPATILGTSAARAENVDEGLCPSYWQRECTIEDANLFRDVARSPDGVATLYATTGGQPARSTRYREFLAPQGYGDELRAAFRLGRDTWGVADLYRDRDSPAFTSDECRCVQRIAPLVAEALRAFATRTPASSADDGPGTALFDAQGSLLSLDDQAERLFEEVAGPRWREGGCELTPVVAAVARAAAVREGRERGPASVRLMAGSGRWLVVRATCLRDTDGAPAPTALTIEPARSSEVAPIIMAAYGLTAREQQITAAVARGLSNQEIAAELVLSPHTVRDHLKAVFAKIGVASRGELVAKLSAEHYQPMLHQNAVYASF